MGERAANVTDFDAVPHEKPLPLEHQLDDHSGVAKRDDSATVNIAFMEQNSKLDTEYALPGSGANSNASWVRREQAHTHCIMHTVLFFSVPFGGTLPLVAWQRRPWHAMAVCDL